MLLGFITVYRHIQYSMYNLHILLCLTLQSKNVKREGQKQTLEEHEITL